MSDKITSNSQSGGITAKNVNVTDSSTVQNTQINNESKKTNIWKKSFGIITFIAALIAILTYFGIQP